MRSLQKAGDAAASTAAYLAALEMHAKLRVGADQYGPEHRALPADVWMDILARLPLRDVVRGVWCVSKGWRALARHPTLWKVRAFVCCAACVCSHNSLPSACIA